MTDWLDFYEKFWRRLPTFPDRFKDLEDFEKEFEGIFEEMFRDLERYAPKELIRERKLPSGDMSKKFGPFVYGYSVTIGPDGKPEIREFGNVKPSPKGRLPLEFADKREPLVDVIDEPDIIRVVAEIPGVEKTDIHLEATGKTLTISNESPKKYLKELQFNTEIRPDSAKASYKNGILEVKLTKVKPGRRGGRPVKID